MIGSIFTFKPVQVPCAIKPGMVYTVCLTDLEFAFIRQFEKASKAEHLKENRSAFEMTDISDLIMKGLLTTTEGTGMVYYELTYLGKKLVRTIINSKDQPEELLAP